jgi:tRNA(Ile)-lysidine synthase
MSPVRENEAEAAFERLARFDHLVLAVSGGPDSMALLVLASEWQARRGGAPPDISVATVDHGLRAQSRAEADFVGKEARRLGLTHVILPWGGKKPQSGLPDAARSARYSLLEEYARSFGVASVAVVTAHQVEDQAETFAMRLARGAGVDGLAAMRAERPLFIGSPVVLVRPLLAIAKARLIATLAERGLGFVDDPTNRDLRYERARLRKSLPALDAVGISPRALATSARRLGYAHEVLRYADERFVATLHLSFGNEVFAAFDREAFIAGPVLLRQRVIARLIARYGGASPEPQLAEVEDLTARLQKDRRTVATLGGAMISSGSRIVRVWREAGRVKDCEIELFPGESRIWDGRFELCWSASAAITRTAAGGIVVRPLRAESYPKIANRLIPGRRPPARATYALPAFWTRGGDLVAVPSLAPFATPSALRLDPEGYEIRAISPDVAS